MRTQTFYIDTYLRPGEAAHVARKPLAQRWPTRAHDHDYCEVFLIERGMTEHWINGTLETLSAGALVFVRPGDAHAFRANPTSGCRIINVMVREETTSHLLSRYSAEFAGRLFDAVTPLPETHILTQVRFERAVHLAQELATARPTLARVEEFLLSLANRVLEAAAPVDGRAPQWFLGACAAARDPQVFRQGAQGFIAAAGRSHEHVCRVSRTHLGMTPSTYVNRVRMEHAAHHLANTTLPISDIASDCGVETLSHFYRLFRDHYGQTPRAYRLRHQRDPFAAQDSR